jgi:hypothetical protein
MLKGAEITLRCLRAEGVDLVFGYPGGAIMPLYDALEGSGVQAEAAERDHRVTLLLEVNPKQVGQLYREWYAIADVTNVHAGAFREHGDARPAWAGPHPPASESIAEQSARAALA